MEIGEEVQPEISRMTVEEILKNEVSS